MRCCAAEHRKQYDRYFFDDPNRFCANANNVHHHARADPDNFYSNNGKQLYGINPNDCF